MYFFLLFKHHNFYYVFVNSCFFCRNICLKDLKEDWESKAKRKEKISKLKLRKLCGRWNKLTFKRIRHASLFIVYVFPESANENESMLKLRDKRQLPWRAAKASLSLSLSRQTSEFRRQFVTDFHLIYFNLFYKHWKNVKSKKQAQAFENESTNLMIRLICSTEFWVFLFGFSKFFL